MSKLKWFARAPATEPQVVPVHGADQQSRLPDVFTPPEVIHGSGGEADWALWDECVAAWDQAAAAAHTATA